VNAAVSEEPGRFILIVVPLPSPSGSWFTGIVWKKTTSDALGATNHQTGEYFIGIESSFHTEKQMWWTLRHEHYHLVMGAASNEAQAEPWADSGACSVL
jgi:hypothetical protein